MGACLRRCLGRLLPWFVGASVISSIVAYLLGIIILGISFPPGGVAALVALVGTFILLFIVGITVCLARCRG